MPDTINGKKTTKKEHEIWKAVKEDTGLGAQATAAVKRYRKNKGKKK